MLDAIECGCDNNNQNEFLLVQEARQLINPDAPPPESYEQVIMEYLNSSPSPQRLSYEQQVSSYRQSHSLFHDTFIGLVDIRLRQILTDVDIQNIIRINWFIQQYKEELGATTNFIYFCEQITTVGANKVFIKIGITNNPDRRRKELQTGNPTELNMNMFFTVYNCDIYLERLIQRLLRKFWIRGEWFCFPSDIYQYLEDVFAQITRMNLSLPGVCAALYLLGE